MSRPTMGLAGSGGPGAETTGVTTATAARTIVGADDDPATVGTNVTARAGNDAEDRVTGAGGCGAIATVTPAGMATTAWAEVRDLVLSADEVGFDCVGSGAGVELGSTMTSGEVDGTSTGPSATDSGVAAAVALTSDLAVDFVVDVIGDVEVDVVDDVVLESPSPPTDELPALLDADGPWAFFVCADPVDGAVCAVLAACVAEIDRLDVCSEDALDPESLLLLGDDEEEELPEPSEPVPSAWAMPDPLARAAPTPMVIAPAPSHVWATPVCGFTRWRPFTRRDLPPLAIFARCPPATPNSRRIRSRRR